MSDDLSFSICDKRVSHPIKKGVFSCERVKREKISTGDMSCSRITEICSYRKRTLIELISQCDLGELIDGGNHKHTQDKHYACVDSADLPSEADTSRFLIHFSLLLKCSHNFENGNFVYHCFLKTGSHSFVQDLPANPQDEFGKLPLWKRVAGFTERRNLIAQYPVRHRPHSFGSCTRHAIKKLQR